MVMASVGDGSGRLSVVFFNQPWRERQLRPDLPIALFGKADVYRGGLQMTNPVVDLIGDRTGRIVPIYPQSEKAAIATWEIAGVVEHALQRWDARGISDPVPGTVRDRNGLVDRRRAFFSIHTPESMAEKEQARRRLAFDELLRVQTVLVMRKRADCSRAHAQEQLGDLKLYRVPDRTTVASRQSKQVRLLDRSSIPITRVYGADLAADENAASAAAHLLLRTINDAAHHLGLPLPSGRVAVFAARDGATLLDHESNLRDLAVDEEVEVDMGDSPDVQVRAAKETTTIDPARTHELPLVPGVLHLRSAQVEAVNHVDISNALGVEIQFELRLRLPEGGRVVRADRVSELPDLLSQNAGQRFPHILDFRIAQRWVERNRETAIGCILGAMERHGLRPGNSGDVRLFVDRGEISLAFHAMFTKPFHHPVSDVS